MSSLTSTTMNGHDINIDLTDASMAGGRTDEDAISGAHKFTTADESTPTPLVTIESFIGSDLESGGSDVEGSDNEIMAKSASADNDASLQRLTGDDPRSPACWSCLGPVNPCRAVCVKLRAVESKCCPEGGKKQINFAEQMSSQSPMRRAVNCFVALTITTAIEACVATVITNFTDTIRVIPLLASFIGVISAVSGNIGLITSAGTIRALNSGHMPPLGRNDWPWDLLKNKEFVKSNFAAVLMALYTAFLVGAVGAILGVVYPDSLGEANLAVFALVLALCQFLAGCMAGLIGNTIPLYFHRDDVDPCTVAGPGETALQDSVGTVLLFVLGAGLLSVHSAASAA